MQLTTTARPSGQPAHARRTTAIHWPALALGVFFALTTAAVLFQDVIAGARPTTSHALALAAIVAAIAAGHMAWPTLRSGAIVPGLLLVVLSIAATAYVVIGSGARNAETQATTTVAAAEHRRARARAEQRLTAIERDITGLGPVRTPQTVRADMDIAPVPRSIFVRTRECTEVTLPESFRACQPILVLRQEMARAISRQDLEHQRTEAAAELQRLGPPVAGTGWAHTARVIAAIPGVWVSEAEIEAKLVLLVPFLLVLIAELGTIAFLHIGLGRLPARAPQPDNQPDMQSDFPALSSSEAQRVAAFFRPDDSGRSGGPSGDRWPGPAPRKPDAPAGGYEPRKSEVIARLIADLSAGRTYGSQREIAERFGVPRATLSDWLREAESRGDIPRRRTVGRCKTIA